MKIAFACLDNRIAPVFDTARQIDLIEDQSGTIHSEEKVALPVGAGAQNASFLESLGVKTLVCGAISRYLQNMVTAHGITVVPFVAGDLQEIKLAWLSGTLSEDRYAMPGCCGRGRGQGGRQGMGRGMGGAKMGLCAAASENFESVGRRRRMRGNSI